MTGEGTVTSAQPRHCGACRGPSRCNSCGPSATVQVRQPAFRPQLKGTRSIFGSLHKQEQPSASRTPIHGPGQMERAPTVT